MAEGRAHNDTATSLPQAGDGAQERALPSAALAHDEETLPGLSSNERLRAVSDDHRVWTVSLLVFKRLRLLVTTPISCLGRLHVLGFDIVEGSTEVAETFNARGGRARALKIRDDDGRNGEHLRKGNLRL